jgi:WbqC-like protein family
MKLTVISQPRYLPALNYVQRLCFADPFIIFDTVQRQARGWENRNQLLLPEPKWLTIPIASSSREEIRRTRIQGSDWVTLHKQQIAQFYLGAPHFDQGILDECFRGIPNLDEPSVDGFDFTDTVVQLIRNVGVLLDLEFKLVKASALAPQSTNPGPGKLVELCRLTGTKIYVFGPNGRGYGIEVLYHEFILRSRSSFMFRVLDNECYQLFLSETDKNTC